jgi:hypothetical protein
MALQSTNQDELLAWRCLTAGWSTFGREGVDVH